MNVEINGDSVNRVSSPVAEKIEEFSREVKKLSNVIDNINTAWSGADALKYINTVKEKNLIELLRLEDLLKQYNKYLGSVPRAYEMLDEIYASKPIGSDNRL